MKMAPLSGAIVVYNRIYKITKTIVKTNPTIAKFLSLIDLSLFSFNSLI